MQLILKLYYDYMVTDEFDMWQNKIKIKLIKTLLTLLLNAVDKYILYNI